MDDLGYRLLQHLTGEEGSADTTATDEGFMLIARSMGPAELLDYDHRRLCGLVVEEGSYNSHVAILARALDTDAFGDYLAMIIDGANHSLRSKLSAFARDWGIAI